MPFYIDTVDHSARGKVLPMPTPNAPEYSSPDALLQARMIVGISEATDLVRAHLPQWAADGTAESLVLQVLHRVIGHVAKDPDTTVNAMACVLMERRARLATKGDAA